MLWSYFHIRRRWLDIRTHAHSSVSSTLLSNVSSTPRKAFSLFSSINLGWGRLGGSFFFCWFLVQDRKLVDGSHTHVKLHIILKIKYYQFLLLYMSKKPLISVFRAKHFKIAISTLLQGRLPCFPYFPLKHHWESIHTDQSPVRSLQVCTGTPIPHSFIYRLEIICLHYDIFQFNILFVTYSLLSV